MPGFGKVEQEKFAYHISPKENEKSILEKGIELNGRRIYLTRNFEDMYEWCEIIAE
jgi:hypothetical protein